MYEVGNPVVTYRDFESGNNASKLGALNSVIKSVYLASFVASPVPSEPLAALPASAPVPVLQGRSLHQNPGPQHCPHPRCPQSRPMSWSQNRPNSVSLGGP